jgi:hypothetical protein
MAEFAGVPDWPEQKLADGRDARLDNQPPLEERLVMEFVEELDAEGITARVAQLLASAAKSPEKIEDKATAGKVGDLLKMSADVRKRIETAREKHNRPLLNAQRALKARADAADGELSAACSALRLSLNAFMQMEARKADDARRAAEAEARRQQEEARRNAQPDEPLPPIVAEKVAAPVARGDLGSRVGTVTEWKHEVLSVRKLPNNVLNHPTVLEAIDKVLRARIRGGEREIAGTRIWSDQKVSVR